MLLLLSTAVLTIIGNGLLSHHGLCDVAVVVEYKGFPVGSEVHVVHHRELLHLVSLERGHVPTVPLQHLRPGHREVHLLDRARRRGVVGRGIHRRHILHD